MSESRRTPMMHVYLLFILFLERIPGLAEITSMEAYGIFEYYVQTWLGT